MTANFDKDNGNNTMVGSDFAMLSLTQNFENLEVRDTLRASKRMTMPSVEITHIFDGLSSRIMKCDRKKYNGRCRKATSFFGVPPVIQAKIWELIQQHRTVASQKFEEKHLLWGMHYLKEYPNQSVMSGTMKTKRDRTAPDEKTLRKWIAFAIDAIYDLKETVIVWENRKTNDKGKQSVIFV